MNTSIIIRIFILLFFIASTGCSSDGTDNNEEVVIDYGTMQAKVSGLTTIPDNTIIHFEPWAIRNIENRISIVGEIKGGYVSRLNFSIPSSIKEPGLYTESIGGSVMEGWSCSPNLVGGENCFFQYLHNFHSVHNDVTLTITQFTEVRITGTFEVIGGGLHEQINITDGQFNILRDKND